MNRCFAKHNVFNVSYHIIWIPKYRKHILKGEIREQLMLLLKEKSIQLNISIEASEIMPDHVHLFIKANPTIIISTIVKHLKSYTSFKLRKMFLY